MNKSKMSGMNTGYGDDIHDMLDNIQMPEDDDITSSSFENSKIDPSKSLTLSRKTAKRGFENNFEANFNNTNEAYKNKFVESSMSPYRDNNEKTLTIHSLNSSAIDDQRNRKEERKHANSPSSSHNQDYNFANPGQFHDLGSIDYGDDLICDDISPEFHKESQFGYIDNTQELILSAQAREDENENEESEYDESEESEYDEQDQSNLGYHPDTLGGSNYNDRSLIDQTHSQFINGKDLTGLYKQSQYEDTNERPNTSLCESEEEHEGEESEQEHNEHSMIPDSEISGIESLSRTDNSKYSRKRFKQSQRYSRSGHSRKNDDEHRSRQQNSSHLNDTNSNYRGQDGTDSIGIRTREGINQESYYETESQSASSWGARIPQDAIVGQRRTQAIQNNNHINLREQSKSPEGRSLIIDSHPRVSRIHKKEQEETDQEFIRSNLLETSDHLNTKTVDRKRRGQKKIFKKNGKKTKNVDITKTTNRLSHDKELENVLSHKYEGSKQSVTPKLAETESHPYIFTTDSEDTDRKPYKFEFEEYNRLKIESRKLKAENYSLNLQNKQHLSQILDFTNRLSTLEYDYSDKELYCNKLKDDLLFLNDFKKGISDKEIKKLK